MTTDAEKEAEEWVIKNRLDAYQGYGCRQENLPRFIVEDFNSRLKRAFEAGRASILKVGSKLSKKKRNTSCASSELLNYMEDEND